MAKKKILTVKKKKKSKLKKKTKLEFPLWCDRIGGVSKEPECRFSPWPSTLGERNWSCCGCDIGRHSGGSDLIPGPETSRNRVRKVELSRSRGHGVEVRFEERGKKVGLLE